MRKKINIPRILKIDKIDGHKVTCMFNNGQLRVIDFDKLFKQWNISEQDIEYPLLQEKEFQKVKVRNQTLSWDNIELKLVDENGKEQIHPYEIDPVVLYENSVEEEDYLNYGSLIKQARKAAGLTQKELAERSGTSRFYISRIENNKTDIELSTFRKIVEAGLGKQLKLEIE